MTKIFFIILILSAGPIFSQNSDTSLQEKLRTAFKMLRIEKLNSDSINATENKKKSQKDTVKIHQLFGCSCCIDTLINHIDRSKIYVLSHDKKELTAYNAHKKKWTLTTKTIFDDEDVKITCMDLYEVNKSMVIRLFPGNSKLRSVDIDPKNGKVIPNK